MLKEMPTRLRISTQKSGQIWNNCSGENGKRRGQNPRVRNLTGSNLVYSLMRNREEVSRQAHILKNPGSNPGSAIYPGVAQFGEGT